MICEITLCDEKAARGESIGLLSLAPLYLGVFIEQLSVFRELLVQLLQVLS